MTFADQNLSETQEKMLSLLPIVPSILSIAGSVAIMRLVHRSNYKGSYKRILFGMSLFDAFSSLVFPLQPFLLPHETSSRVWAVGNAATCSAIGFVQQLSFASFFYTGMLSYYFLATIRFGIRGQYFTTYIEPWIHILAIGFPLVTATFGAAVGAYDEMDATFGCWVSGASGTHDIVRLGWIFLGLPYFFVVVSLMINNLVIYCFVRRRIRKSHFLGSSRGPRIQAIATQALLYIAPMAISTLWSTILRIKAAHDLGIEDELKVFPISVLQALFYPAFGFFNMLVFVRPRYLRYRSEVKTASRLEAIHHVLFLDSLPCVPTHASPKIESTGADAGEGTHVSAGVDIDSEDLENMGTKGLFVSINIDMDGGFSSSISDLYQDIE